MLEFTGIYIKNRATQMIAPERVGESLLVDNFASGDVDDNAPGLHRGKAVLVEEKGCLRGQLTADHDEIALRQEAVDIFRTAQLAEPGWQRLVWLGVAADAEDPHAEGSAKFANVAPDSAGTHDAHRLACQKERSICAMVERANAAVDHGTVQALGKVQNTGHRVFCHGQRIAPTS